MSIYRSKYKGEEVDALLDKVDNLPDLSDIQEALDKLEEKQFVESNLSSDGFTIEIKEPLKSGSLNVFVNGVKYFKDLDYIENLNNSKDVISIYIRTFSVDLNDIIYIEGFLIKE